MDSKRLVLHISRVIPAVFIVWVIYNVIHYPRLFSIFLAKGIMQGAIYALIAVGIGLIYTTTGILNLAHGDIFMLAAVTSTTLLVDILGATSPSLTNYLYLVVVLLICVGLGALLSASVDAVVFRKLRKAPRIAPLIASLGVVLIFQNLGIIINGSGLKKFNSVIPQAPPYPELDPALKHMFYVLLLAVPALLAISYLASRSKNGLAIGAVAHDHGTARMMGINVNKTITRTFLIAGAGAAVAGVIYAQEFRLTDYSLGMRVGLLAYAAAIIGGVNRIGGTIFGGFLIGIIESLNIGIPNALGRNWSETVIYSVFILMLVYRPQGIIGYQENNV